MTAEPKLGTAPGGRPPRPLFGAALLSRVANEMTPVAIVLLVLDRGEGAALAGITAGALALPGIASGPLLGAWLDRTRHPLRVIAGEQAGGAVGLLVLLAAVGHAPPAAVVALALAAGALQPLSVGGMTSVLTGGAGEDEIVRTSSLEASSFGAASVAGPLLAGVLAGAGGAALAVIAQAVLKTAAMGLTLFVAGADPGAQVQAGAPPRPEPLRVTLRAGFAHFANTAPLAAITTTGAIAMAGRGLLTVAFPFLASGALGEAQDFAGYLWAAFAAGLTIGALAFTSRVARWPSHIVAVWGAALAGIAMLPLIDLMSAFGALLALALAGAVYGPSLSATFDVRRRWTPPGLLAQVFTTAASVKTGSFAVGAAASGALVAAVGSTDTIVIAAAVQIGATIVGLAVLKVAG